MKKSILFIALAMIAAITVSCKPKTATEKVVENAKAVLADDVLATLDDLATQFFEENAIPEPDVAELIVTNLTEEEKLMTPDYLLDPAQTKDLITKSQKIAALAYLKVERPVRQAYGMPVDEVDQAIAKLVADVNIPFSDNTEQPLRDRAKEQYKLCEESGDLYLFWEFSLAVQIELRYLISNNVDIFFRNVTDEKFDAIHNRFHTVESAVATLAQYDPEVKGAFDSFNSVRVFEENGAVDTSHETKETAKAAIQAKKDLIAARRAQLMK